MRCSYEQWLDWFILDNKIDTNKVLIEEVIGSEMVKFTYRQFFDRTYKMTILQQQEIQENMMIRERTGGDIEEYLKQRCKEMVEYDQEKAKAGPSHFWEE
ncbi:MAG: hypothetical protein K6F99_08830 [Lachnospiraceae bacterium]|nr:hypothetical protein [Lachnospiraceae bacterium]